MFFNVTYWSPEKDGERKGLLHENSTQFVPPVSDKWILIDYHLGRLTVDSIENRPNRTLEGQLFMKVDVFLKSL